MKYLVLSLLLAIGVTAAAQQKKPAEDGAITCELVGKAFVNKRGKATEHMELYLRCSVQDYFIKLCESKVTEEELRAYLNRGISVKMETHEGEWDRCPKDPEEIQSRVGTYAVILEIVE